MISSIAGAISFVVGLFVLFKLFQKEGIVKAILGFICMLYTFYWGWKNAKEQNLTTVMWVWTGVIVLSVIVSIVAGGSMPTGGDTGGGTFARLFM